MDLLHKEELFLLLVIFQAPNVYPLRAVSWRARQNFMLYILRRVQKLLKVFVSWLFLKPLIYLKTRSLDWSSITEAKSLFMPKLRLQYVISAVWALRSHLQALQQLFSALLDILLLCHEEGSSWTHPQLELLTLVNHSCWDEWLMIVNDSHLTSVRYSF